MRYFVIAGSLLLAAVSVQALAQAKQDFRLVNRTGYTISEVYVSPSKSDDWQEDVLGQDVLENGIAVNITFPPRANACKFDLKVVYDDEETAEWENFNLCEVSKITLRYDRKDGRTWAEDQ